MPSIVSYQKHVDSIRAVEICLPEGDGPMRQRLGTELATINGLTYISLPDGVVLPDGQPEEIAASIQPVTLTPDLRDEIANASPHVRLIRERVAERIAKRYSLGDEIKLLRTAPSAEFEVYNDYAEACRAWGRAQKAGLGL